MMESGDFQNCHPAEYLSRLNLISRLKFAWNLIYFRNHSWVSFSGFSTAYNEVFELLSKGGGITDSVQQVGVE